MSTFRSLMIAGLSLLPLAVLPAQETTPRRRVGREQPARTEAKKTAPTAQGGKSSGQLDKYFVSCLKSDNKAEVTLAKLAAQKATNPEVKAFAQEMVKDHTDFLAKLDRFEQAKPDASTTDATSPPKTRDVGRDGNRGEAAAQTVATSSNDIASQLMQVKHEITDRCIASAESALNEKQDKQFDQCYMFMQIGAHMHMLDTLSVLNSHASPELQQVIDEGLQTAQQHLEHAKQIAKKLEGVSTTATEDRSSEKVSARNSDRNKTDK